ncbi:protein of unknown function (plasmid) [Agreia sp. COWG]|nr:protein of unknown function [Agreia sp. COWG]
MQPEGRRGEKCCRKIRERSDCGAGILGGAGGAAASLEATRPHNRRRLRGKKSRRSLGSRVRLPAGPSFLVQHGNPATIGEITAAVANDFPNPLSLQFVPVCKMRSILSAPRGEFSERYDSRARSTLSR